MSASSSPIAQAAQAELDSLLRAVATDAALVDRCLEVPLNRVLERLDEEGFSGALVWEAVQADPNIDLDHYRKAVAPMPEAEVLALTPRQIQVNHPELAQELLEIIGRHLLALGKDEEFLQIAGGTKHGNFGGKGTSMWRPNQDRNKRERAEVIGADVAIGASVLMGGIYAFNKGILSLKARRMGNYVSNTLNARPREESVLKSILKGPDSRAIKEMNSLECFTDIKDGRQLGYTKDVQFKQTYTEHWYGNTVERRYANWMSAFKATLQDLDPRRWYLAKGRGKEWVAEKWAAEMRAGVTPLTDSSYQERSTISSSVSSEPFDFEAYYREKVNYFRERYVPSYPRVLPKLSSESLSENADENFEIRPTRNLSKRSSEQLLSRFNESFEDLDLSNLLPRRTSHQIESNIHVSTTLDPAGNAVSNNIAAVGNEKVVQVALDKPKTDPSVINEQVAKIQNRRQIEWEETYKDAISNGLTKQDIDEALKPSFDEETDRLLNEVRQGGKLSDDDLENGYGLKVEKVPDDGNCFYESISRGLKATAGKEGMTAQGLRELSAAEIKVNPQDYVNDLPTSDGAMTDQQRYRGETHLDPNNPDEYFNYHINSNQYAENGNIKALAKALNINIGVIREGKREPDSIHFSSKDAPTIYVRHNGNHYDYLRGIPEKSDVLNGFTDRMVNHAAAKASEAAGQVADDAELKADEAVANAEERARLFSEEMVTEEEAVTDKALL